MNGGEKRVDFKGELGGGVTERGQTNPLSVQRAEKRGTKGGPPKKPKKQT